MFRWSCEQDPVILVPDFLMWPAQHLSLSTEPKMSSTQQEKIYAHYYLHKCKSPFHLSYGNVFISLLKLLITVLYTLQTS